MVQSGKQSLLYVFPTGRALTQGIRDFHNSKKVAGGMEVRNPFRESGRAGIRRKPLLLISAAYRADSQNT